LSGVVQDGSGATLGNLALGCMYAGGLPPLKLPDGAQAKLDVAGLSLLPPSIELTGSAGSGAADCTLGAGPGATCANGWPGIDGQGTCASDADCNNKGGSCLPTANCFFGPPIPIAGNGLAMCAMNAFLNDLCGRVDLMPTQATFAAALSARVYFTANAGSPCPRCLAGVCDSGERAGQACTPVGSAQTSVDCPPLLSTYLTSLTVIIPELTTAEASRESTDGFFCEGQPAPGAIGFSSARRVSEMGVGPGGSANALEMTIVGAFCVPPTGTFLDPLLNFPGVGAMAVKGELDLGGLL
jgi:hypothetical protein